MCSRLRVIFILGQFGKGQATCKSLSTKEIAAPSRPLTTAYSQATILKKLYLFHSLLAAHPAGSFPTTQGPFPAEFLVSQSGANTQDPEIKTLLVSAGLVKTPCCCLGSPRECAAQRAGPAAACGSSARSLGVRALLTFVKRQ